jgi:hypothetical protein
VVAGNEFDFPLGDEVMRIAAADDLVDVDLDASMPDGSMSDRETEYGPFLKIPLRLIRAFRPED